jgi:outer membrane biosynthesis protein TonB
VDTKVEKRFIQELSTKMMKHLRLPDMVNEYNIQGKVLASVHVDAEGNVNNVEIIDGLGKSIDRSVTKAFLKVKNIEPIIVNGKASETTVILPILIRS